MREKRRVRAERQYEDVVRALTEVGRDMAHGAEMDTEAFNIRRKLEWVGAQGTHRKKIGRTPSPQVKVERDKGKTCEMAAGRARQAIQTYAHTLWNKHACNTYTQRK